MVMLILSFWWAFARWMTPTPTLPHFRTSDNGGGQGGGGMLAALLAGLLGGVAIFIKFSAAFFVIGGALGLALSRFSFA